MLEFRPSSWEFCLYGSFIRCVYQEVKPFSRSHTNMSWAVIGVADSWCEASEPFGLLTRPRQRRARQQYEVHVSVPLD